MTPEKLIELAKEAMTHAYVPYSGYKVGAALLCADGTVYQGCNIENASFTPTVCAERVAFFKAISSAAALPASIACTFAARRLFRKSSICSRRARRMR